LKILYILRHAKASPKNLPIDDFYRPLYDKGIADADKTGMLLKSMNCKIDKIISSPASRAIATARSVAKKLNYNEKKILQEDGFYEAYAEDLLEYLRNVKSNENSILIAGHNPSLTNLASMVCKKFTTDMATGSVVCIHFNCDNWSEISSKNSELIFYIEP
jgi:phosphohistidine phosphatase